jgi:hypothetical protein
MSKEYYERIATLGQYLLNRINEFAPDISLQDNMQSAVTLGPNPYRPTINDDGSLLIEFSYGLPSRFYTPLGGFDFCGQGVIKEGKSDVAARITSEILSRFQLQQIIPVGKGDKKHIGPVFSVGCDLKGNDFFKPETNFLSQAKSYEDSIDFEERSRIWNGLRPDLNKIRQEANESSFES